MRIPYYGNSQVNHGFGIGSTFHYYDPNSWGLEKEKLPAIDEFRVGENYSSWQLDRFADAILWNDDPRRHNILMFEHLKERRRKEIYTASGTPDETVTSNLSADGHTMYWRTHPSGRKVREGTNTQCGYYR